MQSWYKKIKHVYFFLLTHLPIFAVIVKRLALEIKDKRKFMKVEIILA